MTRPTVTVVTLTRDRRQLLKRAAESVSKQANVVVEHIVVSDRCTYLEAPENRNAFEGSFPNATVLTNRSVRDAYLPVHCASLRFWAGSQGSGDYIAFLDDDNKFEIDHCQSLVSALSNQRAAIGHSWRTLWTPANKPFIMSGLDPWVTDPARSARDFEYYASAGVYSPGSNVIRDEVTLPSGAVGCVDTSEWFFTAAAFRDFGKPIVPTADQLALGCNEDRILTIRLHSEKVKVARSELPSLQYSLGGYSNINSAGTQLYLGEG